MKGRIRSARLEEDESMNGAENAERQILRQHVCNLFYGSAACYYNEVIQATVKNGCPEMDQK